MKIKLLGIVEDVDRHGNVRVYFRAAGKKIRLREKIGTPEFFIEYEAAKAGREYFHNGKRVVPQNSNKVVPHSFRWLCQQYFARAARTVAQTTMARRRAILEGICVKYGDQPFDRLERKHITTIRDTRIESPGAANNIVKSMSAMFAWAIEVGECKSNPCQGIKRLKSGDGWHAWTLAEIEQFEKRHPKGTMPRLALAIFMFTGLRLCDAAILGRQHIANDWIKIRPSKTSHSSGVIVEIPVLENLAAELANIPADRLTFLVTEYGKPFSDKGLGNKMRQWCDEAGLPHCSAHGLRKAGQLSPPKMGRLAISLRQCLAGRLRNRLTFIRNQPGGEFWPVMVQGF